MNLFDVEKGFRKPEEIQKEWEQYNFYSEGEEVQFSSFNVLAKQLKEQPHKMYVMKPKYPNSSKNQEQSSSIDDLIKLLKKQNKFSTEQLELIKSQPQIVFQKQLFQYRYTLNDSNSIISKERSEELFRKLFENTHDWKEASLDELEHISKDSLELLKKSLDS